MESNKNFFVTLILAIVGGMLGLHRFYVGKIWTGLLMLCTNGLFGIMYIFDIITIVSGKFTDSNGYIIKYKKINYSENKHYYNPIIEEKDNFNDSNILNDEEINDYFDNIDGAIKYK